MSRRLNRRSFLSCVVGSSIVGGATLAQVGGAQAQITDSDSGAGADPAGRGRGRSTGVTDRDSGANADPAGRGRGGRSTPQAPSQPQCTRWQFPLGALNVRQSNGIDVTFRLEQQGNNVSGNADFYSPTHRERIFGEVYGSISGNQIRLRASWDGPGYRELGIYIGSINEQGEVEGHNYPFERPGARTNWIMTQRATRVPC